jgi:hypothetical protein
MESNAVILDMDESRELKWTFGAIKNFEKRGREILKRLGLKNERGQEIAAAPMHAGFMLSNFLRIAEIQEAAVAAATGLSGLDGKKGEPSEASAAIDAYLQKGGNMETLQNSLYMAYLVSADPSSISEWTENLKREAEIKRINREKQEARMELARQELAADQKKIGGNGPTTSPT